MIFVAGHERVMTANSSAMFHHLWTRHEGSYPEILSSRKKQDREKDKMVDHLIRHSKYNSKEKITNNILLPNDNWMTPREMKKHGLCDIILKSNFSKKR
jgi:ATP-dependent protease ClpP protease subunit